MTVYSRMKVKRIEDTKRKIKDEIQSLLGLTADIKLVEPKTIERRHR